MWRRALGLGRVEVVFAICSFVACRQTLGIDQYFSAPPDAGWDGGSTACGLPYGTNVCAACGQTHCCAESTACATSAACAPYATCLGDCNGDPRCRAQCRVDHPAISAAPEVAVLGACIASKCGSECGLPCGGTAGDDREPDAAAACQACFAANGCAGEQTCFSSVDCLAGGLCAEACSTPDCKQACTSDHDAGIAMGQPFAQTLVTCGAACGVGADWTCVGRGASAPKSPMVTFTFGPTDYVSALPIAGLDVSVCSASDLKCSQPFGHGQTDSTGTAVMSIRNPGLPFAGLDGYVMIAPSQGYAPHLVYWGFPLSEAAFSFSAPLATEATTQQLLGASGVAQDPARGLIVAVVLDCGGALSSALAAGVEVTIDIHDQLMRELYGTPGTASTSTATDPSGIVLFSNVPVGNVVLTATPLALRKASSTQSVQARAGTVTLVFMQP
jgi:hypothetical protein